MHHRPELLGVRLPLGQPRSVQSRTVVLETNVVDLPVSLIHSRLSPHTLGVGKVGNGSDLQGDPRHSSQGQRCGSVRFAVAREASGRREAPGGDAWMRRNMFTFNVFLRMPE